LTKDFWVRFSENNQQLFPSSYENLLVSTTLRWQPVVLILCKT